MNKKIRQYIGIFAAIILYYIIHEGAHLICAINMGVFKNINFIGVGIQIDVNNTLMTEMQMGIFCMVGVISTLISGYLLVLLCNKICKVKSKNFKAIMYYVTMALLLIDPLYLSVLYRFFGGGDMNGISLLIEENIARGGFGIILIINGILFWKVVLSKYIKSFK